jgi:hypothetical protein
VIPPFPASVSSRMPSRIRNGWNACVIVSISILRLAKRIDANTETNPGAIGSRVPLDHGRARHRVGRACATTRQSPCHCVACGSRLGGPKTARRCVGLRLSRASASAGANCKPVAHPADRAISFASMIVSAKPPTRATTAIAPYRSAQSWVSPHGSKRDGTMSASPPAWIKCARGSS